jgi:hypothetical protein
VPEHPIRLDLDDYLPYLVNRVGSIMALRFGEDVLAQFGLSIAMWRCWQRSPATGRNATPTSPA